VAAVGIPQVSSRVGQSGFGVKSFAIPRKKNGKQMKMLNLALAGLEVKLLMSDRAVTFTTDRFVAVDQITSIDTEQQQLCLASGTKIPANITARKLLDVERIIVNQMQSSVDDAEANQKRDAAAVKLTAKIDTQGIKVDKVVSEMQTLTQMNAEDAAQRDKWCENPLTSREAMADFLLTADNLHIKREVAVALIGTALGDTAKKAANLARVSETTIKRAKRDMRKTLYKRLFSRTRKEKLEAFKSIHHPDKTLSLLRQMAEEDPDRLRSFTDQMIHRAQYNDGHEPSDENQ
jgi:hypothetical protein